MRSIDSGDRMESSLHRAEHSIALDDSNEASLHIAPQLTSLCRILHTTSHHLTIHKGQKDLQHVIMTLSGHDP
jgi:hypothetical protein